MATRPKLVDGVDRLGPLMDQVALQLQNIALLVAHTAQNTETKSYARYPEGHSEGSSDNTDNSPIFNIYFGFPIEHLAQACPNSKEGEGKEAGGLCPGKPRLKQINLNQPIQTDRHYCKVIPKDPVKCSIDSGGGEIKFIPVFHDYDEDDNPEQVLTVQYLEKAKGKHDSEYVPLPPKADPAFYLPIVLEKAPLRIRYECIRMAGQKDKILELLTAQQVQSFGEYKNIRSWFDTLADTRNLSCQRRVESAAWNEAGESLDNITMAARADLVFSDITARLENMQLEPLSLGKSCRFKRAFGGHRFLRLKLQLKNGQLSGTNGIDDRTKLLGFFQSTISLLGYQWRVLRMQKELGETSGQHIPCTIFDLDLFAVRVCGPCPRLKQIFQRPNPEFFERPYIPIADVLNWFISFEQNKSMLVPRAYDRLSLGFSETTSTISFRPSQIRNICDTLADGEAESIEFADPQFNWADANVAECPRVMNDGCARMSSTAGRLIANALGLEGPVPSAFQARLGCYKGIWLVDDGLMDSGDEASDQVWIEVTPAQRKFNPHPVDLDDSSYDPRRTMFEVVNFSKRLRPARLSHTFLPILLARGVEESRLQDLYRSTLQRDQKIFLEAFQQPIRLADWISIRCEEPGGGSEGYLGSLPFTKASTALFLLQHGFQPQSDPYLAKIVIELAQQTYASTQSALRLRLTSSVNSYGVADPRHCLAPGEIHLSFSTTYFDEQYAQSYSFLSGMDVLVGRHPLIRPSDIQRVRAVFRPELAHIRDIVVFPSRGVMPLAGKMSNGDYDGDLFWVCWHPGLVANFRKAPAPKQLPDAESVGIKTTKTTLGTVSQPGKKSVATQIFLELSMAFRCREDVKGYSRWCYDNFVYTTGTFHSAEATFLADLHELLMDGDKMGYEMDYKTFKNVLQCRKIWESCVSRQPLYKEIIKDKEQKCNAHQLHPQDAVDRLVVEAIISTSSSMQNELRQKLRSVQLAGDFALREPLDRFETAMMQDESLVQDLSSLKQGIREIHSGWQQIWCSTAAEGPTAKDDYIKMQILHDRFCRLSPTQSQAREYRIPVGMGTRFGCAPDGWDLLKASVLWSEYGSKPFTFRMAGSDLAFLKAWGSAKRPRSIVPAMYLHLATLSSRKRQKQALRARDRSS